ncbi:MAG: inorganic phosphate transporter [Thermoleophilia bacterium]|jgi:PiT family inorganic phosphate transporter
MLLLILVIAVALGFDFTNGFHDSANAIATSISTRALSPRVALAMAAVLNMVGAFLSQNVAKTVGKGIVALPADSQTVVLAALIGAISWNLITWYLGLPSSSSHALIGGLVGATLVAVGTSGVKWSGIWHKVVLPMVSSPVMGLLVAFLLMSLLLLLVFRWSPRPVNRTFRLLQPVSAGAVALAHGMNDAQKTMGVIWLALITSGHLSKNAPIPTWVILVAASSIALGTYFGGWRIIRTLGTKIIHLDPIHGFAAETTSAAVIWTASTLGYPISTTQTITASIMGAGATGGLSAVKWGVAGNIVWAWILTIPAAGLVAAGAYFLIHLVH